MEQLVRCSMMLYLSSKVGASCGTVSGVFLSRNHHPSLTNTFDAAVPNGMLVIPRDKRRSLEERAYLQQSLHWCSRI